ncbi:PREDICTED: uncharacterized protein LOC108759133 isoform X2 [Trachymyrmex cornetzi]|uniref:uncharacterized protein LOC108759133 isoform X2 n=1 Tax=Trachymyrmex cornetzi TaxID=471704 RepID=UPI00084EE012|nr:PREDICTED: uncharacterized protein LOC108759133 isoform X2 [Trachymyrmex cornetzi]
MPRVIATLLFTSIFIITVYSDVLKCYMCTSLSNDGCDSDMRTNSLQPLECTSNNMVEWQRSIQQHNVLNPLARLFEVDDMSQYYQGSPKDTACAKMVIKIAKQDVTVRTCQTAKTEVIDPCKTMEEKLKVSSLGKMEQCALCLKDACNGTMSLSSKIFYTFLSLFSTLIAFYHL